MVPSMKVNGLKIRMSAMVVESRSGSMALAMKAIGKTIKLTEEVV